MGLKMLGLNCLWQTTLRTERIIQHAQLKQHFLVCPVCGPQKSHDREKEIAATLRVAGPAGRSPAAIGGQSPRAKQKGLSHGRVTKLLLPLCTPQEYDDAQLAQLWLQTHTNPNRPLTPEAAQLIERYGEFFAPRQLRCRHCLALRYGEIKHDA